MPEETVHSWIKKVGQARELLKLLREQRRERRPGQPRPRVISFAEIWTYQKTRQTDAYRVYTWLPANRRQVGNGGAVNRNEGLHSQLRDQLHRLHRRTKGYSKSWRLLEGSVALVCRRLGLI